MISERDPHALNVHGTISGGQINVESSGDLSITGTVDASINDNGTVDTGTGNLLLEQTIAGNGSLVIGSAFTLEVAASTSVETYFDPVATLKIDTASSYTGIINNFQQTDTIDLANLNISSATINAGDTLIATIASGGTQAYLLTGDFSGETVHTTSDRGAGTDLILQEAACYAEGTRIRTPLGETPIERLGPGDLVLTAGGIARPATWIGRRCIDVARHPAPERVRPIRIAPHAFGRDVPRRVLRLSPDHAVLLERHLIPIRLLLNGMTVAYETACRAVTYLHVELESHDILIAENLPAESYLDTGNRSMFDGPSMILHPSFLGNDQASREAKSCRPFLDEAARVNVLWRALAKRAGMLGYSPPDTETATNSDLRIRIGGRTVPPVRVDAGTHVFLLPAGGNARLVSRAAAPCDARPWNEDRRHLGVMAQRIALRQDMSTRTIPVDHPSLTAGWWALEGDGTQLWRWTDGDAVLPLPDGKLSLEVTLGEAALYPADRRRAA